MFRRRYRVEHLRSTRLGVEVRRLRRTLSSRPDVREAILLAAITYRVDSGLMLRLASCESRLNPRARNLASSASGLFQHLYPSTWATTPYAGFSVWSPYASSLAAAFMLSHGRRGEWVC